MLVRNPQLDPFQATMGRHMTGRAEVDARRLEADQLPALHHWIQTSVLTRARPPGSLQVRVWLA